MENVKIRKLSSDAIIPTRADADSAGYDLYANEDMYIESGKTMKISTGIAMAIPKGYFGGIYARSGLSTKAGLRPLNCVRVIDSSYRGEIIVALYNASASLRFVEKGQRIAQIIFAPYLPCELEEVEILDPTERGDGGFGHSGK